MKKNNGFSVFLFLRILSDIILIPVSILLAYGFKFKVGWILQNILDIPFGRIYDHAQFEPYLQVMGLIVVLWVLAFYLVRLYEPSTGLVPEIDEGIKVVKGATLAIFQIMIVSFVYKEFPGSRYVLLYSWFIGILLISLARVILIKIELMFLRKGIGSINSLIIGSGHVGQDIAEKMVLYPSFRLNYIGSLDDAPPSDIHFHLRKKFKFLGSILHYDEVCKKYNIKVIFLSRRDVHHDYILDLIEYSEKNNIELKILSEIMFLSPLTMSEVFDGLPILSTHRIMDWKSAFVKRVFDIVVSFLALIILSPIILLLAILIKMVSTKGPLFYVQERVGKDGLVFKMIKFRSMVADAEEKTGPIMVDEEDETRYHKIGCFLRQWSLDELPQIINVLKGDMSLVGPRPERPHFVEQFKKTIPYYDFRHKVRGGITGWAQINGRSVLTNRPERKIKYDIYYIKNWSFIMDIKIILKTFFVVLKKEEAY